MNQVVDHGAAVINSPLMNFELMEQLQLGDHAAHFFSENAERLSCAIPYVVIGLRRGERCLYIADDNSVPRIYRDLANAGVDVDREQKRGALSVLTKRETYLRYGVFEPEKMISDLNAEVKYSLEHGFKGFRASGEMSWALDLPSALARLIEYEEKLQTAWPKEFGGLCQYDESKFSRELIERMKRLHSVYVRHGTIIRKNAHLAETANPMADWRTEDRGLRETHGASV